jgi:hypothetical protein
MDFEPCNKPSQYLEMVARLSFLIDCEISAGEDKTMLIDQAPKKEVEEICWLVPRLISMSNTMGFLRGQDNRFTNFRPDGITPDEQNDLYADADFVQQRVQDIIIKLIEAGYKLQLTKAMQKYYMDYWLESANASVNNRTMDFEEVGNYEGDEEEVGW